MAFRSPKYTQDGLPGPPKAESPPKRRQSSMPEAQFINVTNTISLDKFSRTQVRVQAMRDYHRRRVQGVGENELPAKKAAREPPSVKSQTQKFRLGKEKILRPWVPVKLAVGKRTSIKREQKDPTLKQGSNSGSNISGSAPDVDKSYTTEAIPQQGGIFPPEFEPFDFTLKTTTIYDLPGAGRLDPFGAMSLLITPRTQLLLHHYFNVRLQSAWLMMPMRKTLFSLAVHDPAMFHSFITHYAAAYSVRFNENSPIESVYHAAMAAKLINERLADGNQALSDQTVATVANMAAYEASNGTVSSMLVHMDGLEHMVKMRGGLEKGGFPLIVQRMIGWTDYHVATSLLQKPRFPPLKLPRTKEPTNIFQSWPQDNSAPETAISSTSTLETLLSGVRDLSQTLRILRQQASMPQEDIWYSDKIYYLQRNLFDIAHDASYHSPIDSVCALAALIYCGHCLRDIPLSYVVTAKAVTRLKDAIEPYEMFNFWNGDYELTKKMLWILVFGGIAAEGKSEREWFVKKFRFCCFNMGVTNWNTAKAVIDNVLWEPDLDDAGVRFWEESNKEAPLVWN